MLDKQGTVRFLGNNEKAKKILNAIHSELPEDYSKFKVLSSGSYKAIVLETKEKNITDVLLRVYFTAYNPHVYMHEIQDGVGDAIIRGLENCGYEVSERKLEKDAFYFFKEK